MYIRDLRVKSKLMIGFAAMALLVLLVSVLAIRSLSAANDRFADYLSGVGHRERLATELRGAANARAIAARNLVLVTSQPDRDLELAAVNAAHERMGQALASLKAAILRDPTATQRDREYLQQLESVEGRYGPVALAIVKLAMDGNREAAVAKMNTECRPLLAELIKTAAAYVKYDQELGDVSAADSRAAIAHDRTLLIVACAFGAGAAIALGWLLSLAITRPLTSAVEMAEAVAAGDLSLRIPARSHDETGQLLTALGRMSDNLAAMISEVRTSADGIATASEQISTGNQDLSSRTEHQASALQETAASMHQMTSTVRQNADTSQQANQLSTVAAEAASQGGAIVGRVIDTMANISSSSKKIGDIIGVIDGIAFQTNILALNAAVEAARAGEQGRGFAVVASEVRSLAQRSATAAKEIKVLIGESVDKVDAGCLLVEDAGKTMSGIVLQVKRVADLVAEINASTSEQSTGIAQVNQAVASIDEGTQQNAALVEQSAAAAESLKLQAAGLLVSMSRFKTEPTT